MIGKTLKLFSDSTCNVKGFSFMPNFDTSQSMAIGSFLTRMKRERPMVFLEFFEFDSKEIPVIIMKFDEEDYNLLENHIDSFKRLLKSSKERALNCDSLQRDKRHFIKGFLDGDEVIIHQEEMFITNILSTDCIMFCANPFRPIGLEMDFEHNPKYLPLCGLKLRKSKRASNSYFNNLDRYQEAFLNSLKELYIEYVRDCNDTGIMIDYVNSFLSCGYAFLVGSKEDYDFYNTEGILPYLITDNGEFHRYSKLERETIVEDRKLLEEKKANVCKRLDFLEKKLKENNLSYTVISRSKIIFDEKGDYKVWTNCQRFDEANYGWFSEKDFIDWINMEGNIPYLSAKLKYFAGKLNGKLGYTLKTINNYNCSFEKDGQNNVLELMDMMDILYNNNIIKKYTSSDFEKEYAKNTKKLFSFFK